MDELPYRLALNGVKWIGPSSFRTLVRFFGNAKGAWHATSDILVEAGLSPRALGSLLEARSTLDPLRAYEEVIASGITVLSDDSDEYPPYLKEIPDSPPVLYLRGALHLADRWSVAVVGTRRLSSYGRIVTERLAAALARSGVTVVSGLARGIDGLAHRAALDAEGRTLAVLGSGLNRVYPPEHRRLAERIISSGALISEFPPDAPPEAGNFPRRNRIISGLAMGTVVVEAGDRSGALITADYALDQGRDVFAVPGDINRRSSRGTNRLIQQGAKPVLDASDILEELNMTMVPEHVGAQLALPTSPEETHLLQFLADDPVHVDELSRSAGLSVAQTTGTLTLMELKGLVRQTERMTYARVREAGTTYSSDPS